EAAVDLADHGVDGDRIVPVGPIGERAFVEAMSKPRAGLLTRFKIRNSAPIAVIQVAGLGYEMTSQVALQLSLLSTDATFLFDADTDVEAATALRRQVPSLDLRAKLFGRTDDAPLLWRCADVIVARPTDVTVARAMLLGAHMVAFLAEGSYGQTLARSLESRRMGSAAANPLLLSSALEPLLRKKRTKNARIGADGAGTIADIVWILAHQQSDVLAERQDAARVDIRARVQAAAEAAEAAAHTSAAAGGLEDLSGGASFTEAETQGPSASELAQLRTEVNNRLQQVTKTVSEARTAAEQWDRRLELARQKGDEALIRKAEQASDAERARMHAALAEMAQLQTELDRLGKASKQARAASRSQSRARPGASSASTGARPGGPAAGRSRGSSSSPGGPRNPSSRSSIDDELDRMRRKTERQSTNIDDELAALKRKMKNKKKR
ncbi:MAG: hypothetical protein MJE77_47395, partial [Proteobacteria bacterium]|nr:hypothetical protein [Pseudomonadota bacterium]